MRIRIFQIGDFVCHGSRRMQVCGWEIVTGMEGFKIRTYYCMWFERDDQGLTAIGSGNFTFEQLGLLTGLG